MSPRTSLLLLLLGLAATAPSVPRAQERGSGIQRCERADGSQVYTDQDCGAFAAVPAPMEGELLIRLASDGGTSASGTAGSTSPAEAPPAPALPRATTLARRLDGRSVRPAARPAADAAPRRGCAHSPTQLAMDLRTAWETGDVNRIAASYDWAGSGTAEATSVMSRLQRLAALPLQDIRAYGTGAGLVQVASAAAVPLGGIVQVTLGTTDRPRTRDFHVVVREGCRFVRF